MDGNGPKLSKDHPVDIDFSRRFLKALEDWDPKARAILFGSRARHDQRFSSDYDLLILSERFTGLSDSERWSLVQTKIKPLEPEITLEPCCFTPAQWEQAARTLLFREIERDGLPLKKLI